MIITALSADNFRKYQQLSLTDLPRRGLIALIGNNESGKSSIGEAIQFVLFGRTDTLALADSPKLIRWGSERANVTLKFEHQGERYHLTRSVNSAGHTMATLFSVAEEQTLADTPETVERQLKTRLGYNYVAWSKILYWGQQQGEVQTDSDQLRSIAGLQEYAELYQQLEAEHSARQQEIARLQQQHQHTGSALAALVVDETRLPTLGKVGEELEARQQHFLQFSQRLDNEAEPYLAKQQRFQIFNQRNRRLWFWTKVSLLVFFTALLGGLSLTFAPSFGVQLPAGLPLGLGNVALKFSAIAALFSAALLLYGWYLGSRCLKPLQRHAQRLADTLQEGYRLSTSPASALVQGDAGAYLQQTQAASLNPVTVEALANVPDWAASVGNYAAEAAVLNRTADAMNAGVENRNQEFGHYLLGLKDDVVQEQAHLEHREQLRADLTQYQELLEQAQRQNAIHQRAVDLLQRSASHSVGRFNQLAHTRSQALLKQFTQAHYDTLELLPNFNLKVLSKEKGDFLDFNEISAGTQRQITLAMRVALANAFADSMQTDAQMMFLDEPFAFFDAQRTNGTLKTLAESVSGVISQIWLTAQRLPDGADFAHVIQCAQGEAELKA